MGWAQLVDPNGMGPNGYSGGPKWDGPNRHATNQSRFLTLKTEDTEVYLVE